MTYPSIHWLSSAYKSEELKRHQTAITDQYNGEVYMHGGLRLIKNGRKIKFLDDLWNIRVETNRSLRCVKCNAYGSVPEARAHHHICRVGNFVILFGGKGGLFEQSSIPSTYEFDIKNKEWSLLRTAGDVPLALYSVAKVIGDQIVVFGGFLNGSLVNCVHVYDPKAFFWQLMETSGKLPSPRCEAAAAVVETKLYVFGGTSGFQEFFSDLYFLDVSTLQWSEVVPTGHLLPMPRAGHSLMAHHTKDLYVFGGYNDLIFPDGGPIHEPLMKFSFSHNQWKLPETVHGFCPDNTIFHHGFMHKNHCYLMGGVGTEDPRSSIKVFRVINPKDRIEYVREATLRHTDNLSEAPSYSYSLPSASGCNTPRHSVSYSEGIFPAMHQRTSMTRRPMSHKVSWRKGNSNEEDEDRHLRILSNQIRPVGH